jgi:hypothetical protein
MLINNETVKNGTFLLQERCMDIIEAELSLFFEEKLETAQLIPALFCNGSINSVEDIFKFIRLSEDEMESHMKNILNLLQIEMNDRDGQDNTPVIEDNILVELKTILQDDLKEMKKTERAAGICEKIVNESLAIIFDKYMSGIFTDCILKQLKPGENLLGLYSLKKQKQKHGELLFHQVQGFLLNLKTDIRNHLTENTFAMLAALEEYYEPSIVA